MFHVLYSVQIIYILSKCQLLLWIIYKSAQNNLEVIECKGSHWNFRIHAHTYLQAIRLKYVLELVIFVHEWLQVTKTTHKWWESWLIWLFVFCCAFPPFLRCLQRNKEVFLKNVFCCQGPACPACGSPKVPPRGLRRCKTHGSRINLGIGECKSMRIFGVPEEEAEAPFEEITVAHRLPSRRAGSRPLIVARECPVSSWTITSLLCEQN